MTPPDPSPDEAPALPDPDARGAAWRFAREGGLEFERFSFFADAVYAIALTLIVVGIDIPQVADPSDPRELWSALVDQSGQVTMFFIAFYVIGQYWVAHHRFVASLAAVDGSLLVLQLAYLAFVAFLPFPAQLMGTYSDNPIGVTLLALSISAVSAMEAVLLVVARRHELRRVRYTRAGYRWALVGSLSPVAVFLVSIPVAFVDPLLGLLTWVLNAPLGSYLRRHRPAVVYE